MEEARLSGQEARDLVLSILEGVSVAEEGGSLRATWSAEMRDWCVLLLDRLYGPG